MIRCNREFVFVDGKTSGAFLNKGNVEITKAMSGSLTDVLIKRFEPDQIDQQFAAIFSPAKLIRFTIRLWPVHL